MNAGGHPQFADQKKNGHESATMNTNNDKAAPHVECASVVVFVLGFGDVPLGPPAADQQAKARQAEQSHRCRLRDAGDIGVGGADAQLVHIVIRAAALYANRVPGEMGIIGYVNVGGGRLGAERRIHVQADPVGRRSEVNARDQQRLHARGNGAVGDGAVLGVDAPVLGSAAGLPGASDEQVLRTAAADVDVTNNAHFTWDTVRI